MVHPYDGVLSSYKNKWERSLWNAMEWFPRYTVKWKKKKARYKRGS